MVKNQGHLEPQEALSFHTMCCTINIIYNFSTHRKFLVPDNPFGKDVKIEMRVTSVKKGPYFLHTNSYNAFDLFFLFSSFSDNVHFYVFWCLLARSKTQYQSFCDWVVWGQNRTKRCKYYHMISNSVRPIPNIRSLSADIIRPTPNTIKMAIFHVFHVILRKKWRFLVVFTNFFKNANKNGS